ncbi:MAG: calcium-binding protein, partial [Planctomycetota bacterium]
PAAAGQGGGADRLMETVSGNAVLTDTSLSDAGAGGAGLDTLSHLARAEITVGSASGVSVDASGATFNVTVVGGAGADALTGRSGNDSLLGGDGADTLSGGPGIDWLLGEGGNDSLAGGDGDDRIVGGGGDDAIDGGAGTDRLFETADAGVAGATANGSLTLTDTSLTGTNSGTDVLTSIERAILSGDDGDNLLDASSATLRTSLRGGAGDDTLIGGSNADHLHAGTGTDSLVGNDGDDTLVANEGVGNDTLDAGTNVDPQGKDTVRADLTDTVINDAMDILHLS